MGHRYNFLNNEVPLSLKVALILANSADPDDMQHNAGFCLGLHCLPKHHLEISSIQRVKTTLLIYPTRPDDCNLV